MIKIIKYVFNSMRDLRHYKMMQRINPDHVQTRISCATGEKTYIATQHVDPPRPDEDWTATRTRFRNR